MSATKEQERAALAQIREIIAGLGEDSYVGKAFEGCFEIAESNIDNDFMDSMQRNYERMHNEADAQRSRADASALDRDQLTAEIERLKKALEREEEWKPYEPTGNTTQEAYNNLSENECARELSDDEAAQLIAEEFGFDRDKIVILREINVYEINRHGRLRKVGATPRRPLFDVWDWYYICFYVKGRDNLTWEVHNGDLHPCIY